MFRHPFLHAFSVAEPMQASAFAVCGRVRDSIPRNLRSVSALPAFTCRALDGLTGCEDVRFGTAIIQAGCPTL